MIPCPKRDYGIRAHGKSHGYVTMIAVWAAIPAGRTTVWARSGRLLASMLRPVRRTGSNSPNGPPSMERIKIK
jgi:hypothetical protein